jgi:hypothetical protein
VAGTRRLQPNQLEALINQNTDGRFFDIFGEPDVNVLKLNLALDRASLTSGIFFSRRSMIGCVSLMRFDFGCSASCRLQSECLLF